MQAIFRLIEDDRPRRIHHRIGDFGAAMGWKAMHKKGIRRSPLHQGAIYLAEVTDTIGVKPGLVAEGTHTLQKFARR